MAVVTKSYTVGSILQGPVDVYLDVYPPPSSATPLADANELALDANGQPTDTGIGAPAAPGLSQVAGGTIAATTYYAKITYTNPAGETLPSTEASLAVSANNLLSVASPPAAHGATGWNVYVSTTAGTETKQNGATPVALGSSWIEPTTGLVSGAALSGTNTTPLGIHLGSIDGPSVINIAEKLDDILDDQHEAAIDKAFISVTAGLDLKVKEFNVSRMQRFLSSNKLATYTPLAGQQVLQLGGQFDSSITARTLLLVTPRRDVPGKFIYFMGYNAHLASAVKTTFYRSKANVWDLKFNCFMDSTRVPGDEMAQFVRQK